MRITVRIDDDLLLELKERANIEQMLLSELVNQLIRMGLLENPSSSTCRPFRQETHDMGTPRVDLTKALALAAELENEEIIRKMELGK